MRLSEQMKQARLHIPQWKRSNKTHIMKAYKQPSEAKKVAWSYCEIKCALAEGRNLKVISHNVNMFTAGFEFTDPATGVVQFYYITPTYEVAVDME